MFTGSVKVYLIFWGSQWGTAGTNSSGYTTLSGDPSGEAPYLQALLAGLGTDGETWSGVATQYCAGLVNGSQSCPSAGPTYTVSNPGTTAVALESITNSTDFGQTNTCGNPVGAGDSCTITITYTPSVTGMEFDSMLINANGGPYVEEDAASGMGVTNLALNKPVTVSSTNSTYVASNMVDGNTSTYWESTNSAWPQSATVDLGLSPDFGGTYTITSLVLTCRRPGATGPRPFRST